MVANLIGSVFNIWYNKEQIRPELSPAQVERFQACWQVFNLVIYPLAVACWVAPILWLRGVHRKLLAGKETDPELLVRAQRTVVNLPWWILAVAGVSWLVCIPVFPAALASLPEPLSRTVVWHLVISFFSGGMIAVTHSFFAVELVSMSSLYPVLFRRQNPAEVPGATPMTMTTRGLMWALSAVVSPIVTLVLLLITPQATTETPYFGVAVGGVAILFGLATVWMIKDLVNLPLKRLEKAAIRISKGDLDTRINLRRADEFGTVIASFNDMVQGLRERERIQQTFGRHVGQAAAEQILSQGDGLSGAEQMISVMFVDVRNFTEHSSKHSPEEVVEALNLFFTMGVETVELHGGMVNKFLGDGFMALFGIGSVTEGDTSGAEQAVKAGCALLECVAGSCDELAAAGWPGLAIGVGINTGPAVVGSIGSPQRQEYTAIGDTVNVAARVESLTKQVGRSLLVTEATRKQLPEELPLELLPPQKVKGKGEALRIYALRNV
ncbi:Adenylate cyclase 1 [Adhaeretor mobilis]|uniref:Adenylate cyclase 1 n=1 Tax=Adhaeretor mobilis TaxID=1930276 RepID=A0A517MRK1_9BACT|nr:Adenylate cyclase 1 [Adhaeretor mobilis]